MKHPNTCIIEGAQAGNDIGQALTSILTWGDLDPEERIELRRLHAKILDLHQEIGKFAMKRAQVIDRLH